MFQRETVADSAAARKILSLAFSAFSPSSRASIFWLPACNTVCGIKCICGRAHHLAPRATPRSRGHVRRLSGTALIAEESNCSEQLARFFPLATAVRVPVQVSTTRPGGTVLGERTVVEFGAPEHAIFLSTLPLEFDDRVRVERESSGDAAEGTVIAVQFHEGRKAVAVRFTRGACHWVRES